jgi:hypothetical protein
LPQSPQFAAYLLWYLPKEIREELIGDLEEAYRTIYNRFGRRKAVTWYYCQVGASFRPFAVRKAQRLIKLGAIGWVGEALRRFIS